MFWFSETLKQTAVDWRPEVHDSDGLAMWNGDGERIWRPLNNPPRTMASAFSDKAPNGFGLLQRDRVFDHYQDGVNYDRRPSLRSAEHTSELQSLMRISYAVFCLKKQKKNPVHKHNSQPLL